jgi:hypothetical protein
MADIKCREFKLISRDPKTQNLRFFGSLNPTPDALWRSIFIEYLDAERAPGNPAVVSIGPNDESILFEVPEAQAEATASMIRRWIEHTNSEAVKRQKNIEDEWKRVQGRFQKGL